MYSEVKTTGEYNQELVEYFKQKPTDKEIERDTIISLCTFWGKLLKTDTEFLKFWHYVCKTYPEINITIIMS